MRKAATGLILAAVVCLMIAAEISGNTLLAQVAGAGVVFCVALMVPFAGLAAKIFVVVSILLAGIAVVTAGSADPLLAPLASAGFIAAFFSVAAALRNAALSSPSLERCRRFIAEQQPGRRYLMLTLGGQANRLRTILAENGVTIDESDAYLALPDC